LKYFGDERMNYPTRNDAEERKEWVRMLYRVPISRRKSVDDMPRCGKPGSKKHLERCCYGIENVG
jgi:hypothetical protein